MGCNSGELSVIKLPHRLHLASIISNNSIVRGATRELSSIIILLEQNTTDVNDQ